MSKSMPKTAVANHRQSPFHGAVTDDDLPLFGASLAASRWQAERARADYGSRREEVTAGLYALRQRLTAKLASLDGSIVGLDALVEKLDEKPSYGSTISRCLNRAEENRRAQIDWDAPFLLDPTLAIELVEGIAALAGLAVTVAPEDVPDPAEVERAAVDVLRDLRRAGLNADEMVARKLGRKAGTVRL